MAASSYPREAAALGSCVWVFFSHKVRWRRRRNPTLTLVQAKTEAPPERGFCRVFGYSEENVRATTKMAYFGYTIWYVLWAKVAVKARPRGAERRAFL